MNLLHRATISYIFRTHFVTKFREVFYEGRRPQNVVETCRRFLKYIINSRILYELLCFVFVLWINAFKLVYLSNFKGRILKWTVFCSIIDMIKLRMTQEVRKHVVNWNKETLSLKIPLIFSALLNFVHGANGAHVRMLRMKSINLYDSYLRILRDLKASKSMCTLIRLCIQCSLSQSLKNRATSWTLSQVHLEQEHVVWNRWHIGWTFGTRY